MKLLFVGLIVVAIVVSYGRFERVQIKRHHGLGIERKNWFCNVREVLKDNIRVQARPIKNGRNFCALLAGTPSFPYKNDPMLVIRLPSGITIDFSDNPVEALLQYKESHAQTGVFFDIGSESMDLYAPWKTGTRYVQIDNCTFNFLDDKIISFLLVNKGYDGNKQQILIRRKDASVFFEFPLTQEEVISLIGPPDKITEYLSE